jgi:hypothetical protein
LEVITQFFSSLKNSKANECTEENKIEKKTIDKTIFFFINSFRKITDKIIDKVKAWQARPLETIYPFVWLDAIHYKIKDGGKYVSKAVYTVLGVNMEGRKEI